MQLKTKLSALTIIVLILLLFLAFGTWDYQLALKMMNENSRFGEFFYRFGELPAILGLLFSVSILYSNKQCTIFTLTSLLAVSFVTFFVPIRYIYKSTETAIPVDIMAMVYILSVILFITVVYLSKKIDRNRVKRWLKPALILLILISLELILVNVLKIIWGRPRMRSLESMDQFKYWYQLTPPARGGEFKSFPSGHTANGFVALTWSLFIPKSKELIKRVIFLLGLLWGCFVAISRIITGAHFLSDVMVGAYITVMLYYLIQSYIQQFVKTGYDEI